VKQGTETGDRSGKLWSLWSSALFLMTNLIKEFYLSSKYCILREYFEKEVKNEYEL
jgi:hypothetical protein